MSHTFKAFAYEADDGVSKKHVNQEEVENMSFTVRVFGKDDTGKSIAVHVRGVKPSFSVYFGDSHDKMSEYDELFAVLQSKLVDWKEDDGEWEKLCEYPDHLVDNPARGKIKRDCSTIWGFTFGKKLPVYNFEFRTQKAYNKLKNIFSSCQRNKMSNEEMDDFYFELMSYVDEDGRPDRDAQNEYMTKVSNERNIPRGVLNWIKKLGLSGISFDFAKGRMFEVIDPLLRFAHVRHLKMAGWIKMKKFIEITRPAQKLTTCDREFNANYEDLELFETDKVCGHVKELAFDIEAYSDTDQFPDPLNKTDYCFQISYTLKNYSDKGFHRYLLHFITPESLRMYKNCPDCSVSESSIIETRVEYEERRTKDKCEKCGKKLEKFSGECSPIPDIDTCVNSGQPVGECEKCPNNNHDVFKTKTFVENFKTEKEMLVKFAEVIRNEDPDITYGYNSDGFDWEFLMARAKRTGCISKYEKMSRIKQYKCKIEEASFNSSALGDNKYNRVDLPGRLNIDLLEWLKRNMGDRFTSFKLDDVAEIVVNEKKHDVNYKQIFAWFREGDPRNITKVGDYCCQDSVLVQKLVNKLDVVTQLFEMADITDTPTMYLLQKGQQIKCFSQLSKEAAGKNFIIPLADEKDPGNFKGAIVLPPKIGKYDTPTAVLDFASLYPSIQMAYKVCYSTIVLDETLHLRLMDMKNSGEKLIIDNVQFDIIEWYDDVIIYIDDFNREKIFTSEEDAKNYHNKGKKGLDEDLASHNSKWAWKQKHYAYFFAQNQPSVIPELQARLKKSRKAVKAMMAPLENSKDPEDMLRYRVLNGRQLAIKVSMNSLYGFTSAFMMNLMALSAAVTAKGRQMIESTKDFMENKFEEIGKNRKWSEEDYRTFFTDKGKMAIAEDVEGENGKEWAFMCRGVEIHRGPVDVTPPKWIKKYPTSKVSASWVDHPLQIHVVGGDSVTGDTPILCRLADKTLTYRTIETLNTGEWETRVDGKEYAACDLEVFTDTGFTYVNHVIRHLTDKEIFRVCTHTGVVDVTKDHSLLYPDGSKVAPKDILIGENLLHADLPSNGVNYDFEYDEDFGIIDLALDENLTFIPDIVFNYKKDIRTEFARMFLSAQLNKGFVLNDIPDEFEISWKGKIETATIYHLFSSIGYTVNIDIRKDDSFDSFLLYCTLKTIQIKSLNAVKSIKSLGNTKQFVYDIETGNHHFHVGPGRLQAHNTDSVFCNFPKSSLAETISLCHMAADLLTETVFARPPIEMEYEKTYLPMVIQKKKNYVGIKYEMDDFRWKIDFKGIAVKRRNYCEFVKTVFWSIIYPIMGVEKTNEGKFKQVEWDYSKASDKALEALRHYLLDLVAGKVPISQLVMSASMKSNYKGPSCTDCKGNGTVPTNCLTCKGKDPDCRTCRGKKKKDCKTCGGRGNIVNLPHIQLAQRMKERDEGSAPKSGQRFGYIVVNDDSRGLELSARTEDPKYAQENNLSPDFMYYLDQQVRKPITTFMTVCGKEKETNEIFLEAQRKIFNKLKRERQSTEISARADFFNGKKIKQIAPLKKPKDVSNTKAAKKAAATEGIKSIQTFFKTK